MHNKKTKKIQTRASLNTAISHHAATLDKAGGGSADNLTRMIGCTLGQQRHQESNKTDPDQELEKNL